MSASCCPPPADCLDCPIVVSCLPELVLNPGQLQFCPNDCKFYYNCAGNKLCLNPTYGLGLGVTTNCILQVRLDPASALTFNAAGEITIDCAKLVNCCALVTQAQLAVATATIYNWMQAQLAALDIPVFYPIAAAACEVPAKLYGVSGSGVQKEYAYAAIFSTSVFVQSANSVFLAAGEELRTQLNNPHTCRSMNVLANMVVHHDFANSPGQRDTHVSFALNTTGFVAPNTLFTQYHDELTNMAAGTFVNANYGTHSHFNHQRAIVVAPGGSAYLSTVSIPESGYVAPLNIMHSHVLFGVTV